MATNVDTIQGQRDALTFIDKFIKTTIPADDDQLKEYVTTYQIHRHTHIVKKTGQNVVSISQGKFVIRHLLKQTWTL